MRIFVTGASGLVGSHVVREALHQGVQVTCADIAAPPNIEGCDYVQADVRDASAVSGAVRSAAPDAVVHAAAFTRVDDCELQRRLAYDVNVSGTANVAAAACNANARIVYTSTAYVFRGDKGGYREEDSPDPVNYYAQTKLLGEREVSRQADWAIARLDVPYGWLGPGKPNFVQWLVSELRAGRKTRIVGDQVNSPTHAESLACALLHLCKPGEPGVFHTAGPDRLSRFDFALRIAEAFKLDSALITPCKTLDLGQAAKRPYDCSLDSSKFEMASKIRLEGVLAGLHRMRKRGEGI